MSYDTKTRQTIVETTKRLINEKGIQKLTVREIVNAADANVSAIKYHFTSKDELITEVLLDMLADIKVHFDVFDNAGLSIEEKLEGFFLGYFNTVLQCPSIFINLIQTNHNVYQEQFANFIINDGLHKIKSSLEEANIQMSEEHLLIKIFQGVSAIAFPTLLDGKFQKITGRDSHSDEFKEKYIKALVSGFLH